MNDERFAEIEALAAKTTPGPWRWEKRKCDGVQLYTPKNGHCIVMDFVRQGMQSAQPRFSNRCGQPLGGVMIDAVKLDLDTHPDAQLIAAAPELLAEVLSLRVEVARLSEWISVDERLPEPDPCDPRESVDVLATDGESVFVAYTVFSVAGWWWLHNGDDHKVTHWMPLPKLPGK